MSRFTVAYAPAAATARNAMPTGLRQQFDTGMAKLADDPYGAGSAAIRGERDRRDATVAGCFIVYYVAEASLRITTVRIRASP
ncbi:hypothetical protein [Streptomyces jumonjinensis]|uniref:Type II toxin-antitoxin system RelE/ParE family toxin n=1 Tax=Streptomyces jumonjinensis TaxID=1945 RepID=A0A646KGY7_STRJU|nr:hypothetical protein [Streptomyces jumonjinensis]MQT01484.1 hypothetical protein [Streptomyces jumonjinensis]